MINRYLAAAFVLLAATTIGLANSYNNPNGSVSPGFVPEVARQEVTSSNPLPVRITGASSATTNINLEKVGGANAQTGAGTASGALRVELPTDGTGRVDVRNVTGTVSLPTGAATAALQTTANTNLGAPGATACATDNGSCSLNALLQRISQRITSLIALLPTSIGQKNTAGSLSVTLSSDHAALPLPTGAATAANQTAVTGTSGSAVPGKGVIVQGSDGTNARNLATTTAGALVTKPYASPDQHWQYAAASGGILNTTTAVTIASAAGSGLRNYVTSVQIASEALTNATEIAIRDGAAGTVLWRSKIGTAGWINGREIVFPAPLKSSANTLLEVVTLTASGAGAVYVNAQGYVAP